MLEIGNITLDSPRDRWRARVRVRQDGGPWRQLSHTTSVSAAGGKGKRAAMREARAWVETLREGALSKPSTPSPEPARVVRGLAARRVLRSALARH